MGEGLLTAPWAARVVRTSEQLTGMALCESILERADELTGTQVAQPALLLVEWLAFLQLGRQGLSCDAVAGHSLGEYAALAAAEVFSWEEAMSLVAARGRAMATAAEAQPGGMSAVVGLPVDLVEELAALAGCAVANYNAPQQTVLAGERQALDRVARLAEEKGGKAVALPVAGAFHTSRMAAAQAELVLSIDAVRFGAPTCAFVSGVSGRVEYDPGEMKALLKRQMTSPVRWTEVVDSLLGCGVREAVEVGPGKVLTRLGRMRTDAIVFRALGEVSDYG